MTRGVFVTSTPLTVWELNDVFDKPRCNVYADDVQTITTATDTVLSFNIENFDIGGLHSTSSNIGRITIPAGAAGLYLLEASLFWDALGTGLRAAWLRLNGTTTLARSNEIGGSYYQSNRLAAVYSLAVNDYVEVVVRHTRGSDLDVLAGNYPNHFSAMWLRPTP